VLVDVDNDEEEEDVSRFNKFKNISLKDYRFRAEDVYYA
jgi:hypothetical protein